MNAEFFDAIAQIEREKGIPKALMEEKITQALISAFKRDHVGATDRIVVEMDDKAGEIRMFQEKTVVETVEDPEEEISVEDAAALKPDAQPDDIVRLPIVPRDFGRIAAQTAKQVIIQGIREAERGLVFEEFTSKEHQLLSALVSRFDARTGSAVLEIGGGKNDKIEALLVPNEQVPQDNLRLGERIRVYVVEVRKSNKGPMILISRTHPGLVKRLFELEVPEIHDGTVEIKSVSREAGQRTKIAVWSTDPNVDCIGACVGAKGARVGNIIEELRGEKIDIIKYSEDPADFVAAALSPAEVLRVDMLEDGKSCRVIVPDDQLSLAIGKEGQNARLAARLTGCKIDIKPYSSEG